MTEPDMQLPAGRTCSDCAHFARCAGLFQCKPTNTTCDWSPSRFMLDTRRQALIAETEQAMADKLTTLLDRWILNHRGPWDVSNNYHAAYTDACVDMLAVLRRGEWR